MNITAELLAVIAALGPITLLSSVMGIKVIVNESTRSIRVEASSSAAPRVVSAVMPTEVNHHRSMVGRKHAVNGIPRDDNRLDVDQLILMAGAEKDMVDALVDELRTGLKRSRWMC
jgi:hypothetical protein